MSKGTEPSGGEMNIRHLLTHYQDHDGLGWPAMFAYLRTYDYQRLAGLTASIVRDGLKEPIALQGKTVCDGLHRLAVLDALGWRQIPVIYIDEDD